MPLLDDPWLPAPDGDGSIPAVRPGAPVAVYRYDGAGGFSGLPNVECLSIAYREGTDPGHAEFRYDLASGLDGAPASIEQALGTGFVGALTINAGDRLVVRAQRPDGVVEALFDGYAVDFSMGLAPESEEVHVGAVGVAWRAWDTPIASALMRDSSNPRVGDDTQTNLPAVLNPGGRPNCTPDGYMSGSQAQDGDHRYPTFLDPDVIRDPDRRTYWTLSKAARYILYRTNPDRKYIRNPDGADLDKLLVSPGQYGDESKPINCPDTPITGKDWPGTVQRLVSECGFATRFRLATDDAGLPVTSFEIFRGQATPVKQLYLAARGTPFDPTLFNLESSGLHRDVSGVVNQVVVLGGPTRYEASFILAPGFPMVVGDGDQASLHLWKKNDADYATNRDKYRLFVFDETGEGHYAPASSTKVQAVPSLDDLLGKGKYAGRRRRPIGTLLSRDAAGKPYPARLAISKDYVGASPGLWDGSGTWQPVESTTWRLLDDRLAIEITGANPESWDIGDSKAIGAPYPWGIVHVVNNLTRTDIPNFKLRLTCVIEGDTALDQVAGLTGASPIGWGITRYIDASDRFRIEIKDYPSEFNFIHAAGTTPGPVKSRDDSQAALAEAQAIRAASEAGVLEGPVTIPRLTTYYGIGDRIGSIEGRGLGLRTDGGADTPVYPVVVGVRYEFDGDHQATTLDLSDAGTDRTRYRRRPRRQLHDDRSRHRFNRRGSY